MAFYTTFRMQSSHTISFCVQRLFSDFYCLLSTLVISIVYVKFINLILQLFHFGIPEMTLYPGPPVHPLSQPKTKRQLLV